jgi:hypothetical protein
VVEPVQPTLRLVFSSIDAASPVVVPRRAQRRSPSRGGARRPFRRRLRRGLVTVLVVCSTFAGALVAADLQLRSSDGTSAAAPSAEVEREATALTGVEAPFVPPVAAAPDASPSDGGQATEARPSGSDAVPDPGSRQFAWAPTDGASGYHMKLFQGNTLVFAADTVRPEITIPAKWNFNRRVFRFDSLEYRWYVWPIVSGKRTSQAVVQARLVVEDR